MRYRLRTLLIVLAVGPPGLAVAWMIAAGVPIHPVLLGVAIYMGLVLVLVGASWALEAAETTRLARFLPPRRGACSYCGEAKRPVAEGIAGVLICRDCAAACVKLLDRELQKQSRAADSSPNAP